MQLQRNDTRVYDDVTALRDSYFLKEPFSFLKSGRRFL